MTRLLFFLFACVAAHASQLTIPWVYAYRVRAENKTATGSVYGDYSNAVEVKTNPKPN